MARLTGLNQRDRAVATRLLQAAPPPRATYRLQLHEGFSLAAAREIVPYLARLGISHVYASPIWESTPGSTHGYDVVAYDRVDAELGGRDALDALTEALDAHGLSLVLDVVPNHMGIGGGANPWWQDVLENGRASEYAPYFDIDWLPLKHELRNQVLVPTLGDQFGLVLERGELRLGFADGAFAIDYYGTPFPVAPPTYPLILQPMLDEVRGDYRPADLSYLELESIAAAFERLPSNEETDADLLAERRREQLLGKHRLAALLDAEPPMRAALETVLTRINGAIGDPASFDALEALLDAQSYRLAYWRVAAEEINYRRFFAINELAAIRQEVPRVFTETHRLLLELIASGQVTGARIDHPDGLWDPAGYFQSLQQAAFLARMRAASDARRAKPLDDATWEAWQPELDELWTNRPVPDPLWVVVEKILEPGEQLPPDWPVAGTVGYEFARVVSGLFVQRSNRRAFDELSTRFTGNRATLADIIYEQKKRIMRVALVSEVNVLARALDRLTEQDRRTRDYTLNNLRDALREVIACFPVYRPYLTGEEAVIDPRDRRVIERAVDTALRRNPGSDPAVFEFLRGVLLLRYPDDASPAEREAICRFVMKFQQLTGPVMAKGVEDTAFYRYNRLLSLNEVGGDPAEFGTTVEDFHRECLNRARRWPSAMLSSSTHDTKRSEDVRARISALSEFPREWRAAVNRWARLNRKHKTRLDGQSAPDRNDEYHLYQSLIGIWPFDGAAGDDLRARLTDYMIKAVREAQVHSSWVSPDESYEKAVTDFIATLLDPDRGNAFLDDVRNFVAPLAIAGAYSSLAQQVLKLTAPGVPDLYQGTELWDFSLVDPDNRRPVDYAQRRAMLDELLVTDPSPEHAAALLADLPSGQIKLALTARTLAHRAAHPALYVQGSYEPLPTHGPLAENLIAFRRTLGDEQIVVVVPRLTGQVSGGEPPIGAVWQETAVVLDDTSPNRTWRNEFTGETLAPIERDGGSILPIEHVLRHFPVALLSAPCTNI